MRKKDKKLLIESVQLGGSLRVKEQQHRDLMLKIWQNCVAKLC
jgi:hypothetical protein